MKETINDLMTVKEAAHFLRRSERWLREAIARPPDREGSIPHFRLPGKRGGVRFVRNDLLSWLRNGAPPAAVWESQSKRRGKRAV